MAFLLSFAATTAFAATPESRYLNTYLEEKMNKHEGAFVSGCVATVPTATVRATIVFFPKENSGVFIVTDSKGALINLGDVDLSETGEWDLGDLEGGMETISILSDVYQQLTTLPFSWIAPDHVKKALVPAPTRSCRKTGTPYN
jgi:hypothetical protein